MSANIVIVGNQAAGKTVFLTAFSKMTGLTRDNKETIEYLKEKENAIYRECEWPQSTRRCENLSLSFDASGKKYRISAFDCPGQDFDALYEEGRKNSSEDDELKELKDAIEEADVMLLLVDFVELLKKPHAEKERSIRSLAKCCESEAFSDKKLLLLVSKLDKLRQAEYDEKTLFDLPDFEPLKRQLVDNKKIEVKYIFSVETELTDDGEEKPKKGSDRNPEIKEKMEDILRRIKTAVLKKELEKIDNEEGEYSDEELLKDKEPYKKLEEEEDFFVEALGGGGPLGWNKDKGKLTNISNDVWVKWELTFTCGGLPLFKNGKQLPPGKSSRPFKTTYRMFSKDDIEDSVLKVVPREDAGKARKKRRGGIERELNSLGMKIKK